MRFYDLKGRDDEEARKLIAECPKVEVKEVLENPESLLGKILVFRGNYEGFDTNRLCARTFEYISEEDKWKVSDVTVYDMVTSSFCKHFLKQELESKFEAFCKGKGFVMDAHNSEM